MFRLTFLGTSSGIPTLERNVSAIAVECRATRRKRAPWLLIDCGEATQHQILKSTLSLCDLSAILITHVHGDHCYGLAGLLASLAMHGRCEPLTVIAPVNISRLIDAHQRYTELHLSYKINFIAIEEYLGKTITISLGEGHCIDINIHPLSHRVPSYGFAITQTLYKRKLDTEKLSTQGIANIHWSKFLKKDDSLKIDEKSYYPADYVNEYHIVNKIVIAGDNDTPELLIDVLQGAQVLVHEATYTEDIHNKILSRPIEQGGFNPKHANSKQVAVFAQHMHLPHLILTHFSARFALYDDPCDPKPNIGHIRTEVQSVYDGILTLAQDFFSIDVGDM